MDQMHFNIQKILNKLGNKTLISYLKFLSYSSHINILDFI